MGRRTQGWADRRLDSHTDAQTDGWTGRWTDAVMDAQTGSSVTLCRGKPSSHAPSPLPPGRCRAPRVGAGGSAGRGAPPGGSRQGGLAVGAERAPSAAAPAWGTLRERLAPGNRARPGKTRQGSISQRRLAPDGAHGHRLTSSDAGRSDGESRTRPAWQRAGKSRSGLALKGGTEPRPRRLPSEATEQRRLPEPGCRESAAGKCRCSPGASPSRERPRTPMGAASSRLRGRSRHSLLCWETAMICNSGSCQRWKTTRCPRTRAFRRPGAMPGHGEMPLDVPPPAKAGPFPPLRLRTAGGGSAKGTGPRPDISAFASKWQR